MAACDKWVVVKIFEFVVVVGCVVTKRIADDDATRLALRLQRLSREWSLLRSITWDAVGGSFADAVYGGYVIITFGLLLGRLAREIPRGRRVLEGFMLGLGFLLFLVLGGLVLSSIDSIRDELVAHAASLGALSLLTAALFLIDLMGPRAVTTARHAQTEAPAAVTTPPAARNAADDKQPGADKMNGKPGGIKKETSLFSVPSNGYTKFSSESIDMSKDDLEKSKFGSFRSGEVDGAYVRLSDPATDEADRLHYERELAKFNERFVKQFLRQHHGPKREQVKEDYLPELQTPVFAQMQQTRARSLLDELSPSYELKSRTAAAPTLHQLEDYLRRGRERSPSALAALFPMAPIAEGGDSLEERAGGSPTDPGFVQYAARRWPDRTDGRTPRHSPTK